MPRVFDGLVFNKIKSKLVQKMSKFQIGAKPGHRPEEHIFVVKSVLSLYSKLNVPLLINTFDISKYFDNHVLIDAQECLADASVDKKCYRLFYKLNCNTNVQALTPHGLTKAIVTGENLGQGSRSAATACSLSLSRGVEKHYSSNQFEVDYGTVRLGCMQYQDDALRILKSVEGAQDGVNRFQKLMGSKMLELNVSKSIYMIVGKKKNVSRIRNEIESKPILYNGKMLMEKETEKWLGDVLNVKGSKASTL